MKIHTVSAVALAMAALSIQAPVWAAPVVATFDDLPSLPATNLLTDLNQANNGSSVYDGITWDSRFVVVGDAYRIDTTTPGPLYGMAHSGDYFVTNGGDPTTSPGNNGLSITTNMVLTGAWFGQNAFYGFGDGADQVTITAMDGSNPLASVVFDLPAPAVAGQPGPLGFVDTSSFESLTGITGYVIDRAIPQGASVYSSTWVADDFTFLPAAPVPEPESYALLLGGLGVLGWARRRARARA